MRRRASEHDTQSQTLTLLRMTGWLAIRVNSGAMAGEHTDKHGTTRQWFVKFVDCGDTSIAVSDIMAFRDGRFLALECKRPGWKPPKPPAPEAGAKSKSDYQRYLRQRRFLERWIEAGGEAAFVTSLEDVIEIVERRRQVA